MFSQSSEGGWKPYPNVRSVLIYEVAFIGMRVANYISEISTSKLPRKISWTCSKNTDRLRKSEYPLVQERGHTRDLDL